MSSSASPESFLKLALALAIGLGAGWAVKQAVWPNQAPALDVDPSALYQPNGRAAPSAATAQLEATVLVGGAAHNAANGRIALPSGSRFELQLSANRSGTVAVYAINPEGVASAAPLWTGQIRAGSPIKTAAMRLEGTQGLETLRVVLRVPGQGQGAGLSLLREVQIWHL